MNANGMSLLVGACLQAIPSFIHRRSLGAFRIAVGSELARAVWQSASKLADLRDFESLGVPSIIACKQAPTPLIAA